MDRRPFLRTSALAGGSLLGSASVPGSTSAIADSSQEPRSPLDYAPIPNQFEAHAGSDILDQIAFLAEQGFKGFEGHNVRGRSMEEQRRIGQTGEQAVIDTYVTVDSFETSTS